MTPSQPLRGQKTLVTGANPGIGEEAARALGTGADVVVAYLTRPEDAKLRVTDLRTKRVAARALRADVSREAEVLALDPEFAHGG